MVPVNIFQTQHAGTPVDQRVKGVAVSSTNTYYSSPWSTRPVATWAVSLQWTGTPTGTLSVWWSNKELPDFTNDNDWHQDTTLTISNPAGSAGKMGGMMSAAPAQWWRIKYVNASGSGTLFGQVHSAGL